MNYFKELNDKGNLGVMNVVLNKGHHRDEVIVLMPNSLIEKTRGIKPDFSRLELYKEMEYDIDCKFEGFKVENLSQETVDESGIEIGLSKPDGERTVGDVSKEFFSQDIDDTNIAVPIIEEFNKYDLDHDEELFMLYIQRDREQEDEGYKYYKDLFLSEV